MSRDYPILEYLAVSGKVIKALQTLQYLEDNYCFCKAQPIPIIIIIIIINVPLLIAYLVI